MTGGVPYILAQLPSGLQDFALLLLIFAFFSCGSSVQGAGRLMFSYARDAARCYRQEVTRVHPRFKTPVNALLAGAVVSALFVLFEFATPSHNVNILWFTYPGKVNVLPGLADLVRHQRIYLSFLLTVIEAGSRRARGWKPEGKFTLGRWGWPVIILAGCTCWPATIDMVAPRPVGARAVRAPTRLITLVVMVVVFDRRRGPGLRRAGRAFDYTCATTRRSLPRRCS